MSELSTRKSTYWIGLITLALMLSACAGIWESAPHQLGSAGWSLTPPDGWMHLPMADADMLSQNGPYLEYILVQSRALNQGFRFTKKKLDTRMLPFEAARLIIANMRSDSRIRQFRLLASEPAMVGGHPGFKLTYTHQDQMGVEVQTVYYGVVLRNMFFNLRYSAAKRHYFESQLPAFNSVLHSLRFTSDLNTPAADAHAPQVILPQENRS